MISWTTYKVRYSEQKLVQEYFDDISLEKKDKSISDNFKDF
jgi:hypothetical protein